MYRFNLWAFVIISPDFTCWWTKAVVYSLQNYRVNRIRIWGTIKCFSKNLAHLLVMLPLSLFRTTTRTLDFQFCHVSLCKFMTSKPYLSVPSAHSTTFCFSLVWNWPAFSVRRNQLIFKLINSLYSMNNKQNPVCFFHIYLQPKEKNYVRVRNGTSAIPWESGVIRRKDIFVWVVRCYMKKLCFTKRNRWRRNNRCSFTNFVCEEDEVKKRFGALQSVDQWSHCSQIQMKKCAS